MDKNTQLSEALRAARRFILTRHNMGARQREKTRLHVLKIAAEALDDQPYEYTLKDEK